ncbi:helix-turn-helix domain-containing protein [Paenibacillus guangzhouensis]|uniref:helix-turn-helix domain-containing protein n=1 Tax=Paenibacillus guangzhouensis TaxID=1473112 RepID=UPI001266C350|nr:AraC family transcriptional regulator [Paenibacillus guangzhouensis]
MTVTETSEGTLEVLLVDYAKHYRPYDNRERSRLPHYLIRLQTEGSAHVWVNDHFELVEPGDLLLYREGDIYELKIGFQHPASNEVLPKINSMDYFLMIRGSWVEEWWNQRERKPKTRIRLDDRLITLWRQMIQEKRRFHDSMEEIVQYFTKSFFLMLDRLLEESNVSIAKSKYVPICNHMKDYIEQHAAESITLQDVADHAKLSVSRAGHLFKEVFGQTIMDYAIEVRISTARERIEFSKMTLEQIAELCGFQSYTYFHRTFKTRTGLSPSEYRELNTLK